MFCYIVIEDEDSQNITIYTFCSWKSYEIALTIRFLSNIYSGLKEKGVSVSLIVTVEMWCSCIPTKDNNGSLSYYMLFRKRPSTMFFTGHPPTFKMILTKGIKGQSPLKVL